MRRRRRLQKMRGAQGAGRYPDTDRGGALRRSRLHCSAVVPRVCVRARVARARVENGGGGVTPGDWGSDPDAAPTHALALSLSVKRKAFCVGHRLKAVKHKAWATRIVAPKQVGSTTTKG